MQLLENLVEQRNGGDNTIVIEDEESQNWKYCRGFLQFSGIPSSIISMILIMLGLMDVATRTIPNVIGWITSVVADWLTECIPECHPVGPCGYL